MVKRRPSRLLTFALVAFIGALRSVCSTRLSSGSVEPGRPKVKTQGHKTRFSRLTPILTVISVAAIVLSFYKTHQWTRQPDNPPVAGTAQLVVPGNPFTSTDQFQLHLIMNSPESTGVQYQIIAGCGTSAKHVLLILSGNARFQNPVAAGGSGQAATERTVTVSYPWFQPSQSVQVFDIPVHAVRCPRKVSPTQLGTPTFIGQYVHRSFENSGGSSYALRLPLVGNTSDADAYIPALRGWWAAPVHLKVFINAGTLPLKDRIDVAQPTPNNTGQLEWTSRTAITPSVSWTDTNSANRNQFLVFLLGAVIGIFGSLLATILFEWARGPQAPNPNQ
jgi:hypothetical protein